MTRLEILNHYRNCICTNIDFHNYLHTKHTKFNQYMWYKVIFISICLSDFYPIIIFKFLNRQSQCRVVGMTKYISTLSDYHKSV